MLHEENIRATATIVKVNGISNLLHFSTNILKNNFPKQVHVIFQRVNHHDNTELLLSGSSYDVDYHPIYIKCLIPSKHFLHFYR